MGMLIMHFSMKCVSGFRGIFEDRFKSKELR